jgi:xanthine/uracil permease
MHESFTKLAYAAKHPIETARISATAKVCMFNTVAFSGIEVFDTVELATGNLPPIIYASSSASLLLGIVLSANVLAGKIELPGNAQYNEQTEG